MGVIYCLVGVIYCWCLIHCSALEKIILNGYSALGLMYFFTVGEDEVKAWTVQVLHVQCLLLAVLFQ